MTGSWSRRNGSTGWGLGPPTGAHQRIHLKLSESTMMQSAGMVRGTLPCNHRAGSRQVQGPEPDLQVCPPARSPTTDPHLPSCPSSLGFSFWDLCFSPPFSRHLLLKTRKRQGCLAAARGSRPATLSVNFMLCKFHFNEKTQVVKTSNFNFCEVDMAITSEMQRFTGLGKVLKEEPLSKGSKAHLAAIHTPHWALTSVPAVPGPLTGSRAFCTGIYNRPLSTRTLSFAGSA